MKYYLFIDESQTLNKFNKNNFSISIVIIKEENYKKTKNKFKKLIGKYKIHNNLDKNVEIKGHFLKLKNDILFVDKIFEKCILENNFICSFIRNKTISEKFLKDKGTTYNFMIKCGIERAISNGFILNDSELIIYSDVFNKSKIFDKTLENYLNLVFVFECNKLSKISHQYIDSKKS